MSDHARLSPSSSARWVNCAGCINEESIYPDVPGEAAIDGTGSHLLLELCLQNNVRAEQYDQQVIGVNHEDKPGGWLVDSERCKRVQACLDYIHRRVTDLKKEYHGATVTVESESTSNPGAVFNRSDWYGTCDVTITVTVSDSVVFIETIDYKDGRGWVNVKDNTQLVSYLAGKLHASCDMADVNARPNCRMTIVQPKTNPMVRYQCSTRYEDNFSAERVNEIAVSMNVAANKTDLPNPEKLSGSWCQWCKANPKRGGHCDTAVVKSMQTVENMNEISGSMFESIQSVIADPKSLTNERLSEIMSAKEALISAFDACENEIIQRLETGVTVPGYAMTPGRGSRVWSEDEEEVVKKLRARKFKKDEIYPAKLISVAQVLKSDKLTDTQKKKLEDELVTTIAGKLKLTKVSHKKPNVDEMFMSVSFF